jgi:hypothetical protein
MRQRAYEAVPTINFNYIEYAQVKIYIFSPTLLLSLKMRAVDKIFFDSQTFLDIFNKK